MAVGSRIFLSLTLPEQHKIDVIWDKLGAHQQAVTRALRVRLTSQSWLLIVELSVSRSAVELAMRAKLPSRSVLW